MSQLTNENICNDTLESIHRLKEEKIRPDRNLRPAVLPCVVYCIELSETKTNWNKLLYHSTSIVFIETTTHSSDD